jgi:hypothetical protein
MGIVSSAQGVFSVKTGASGDGFLRKSTVLVWEVSALLRILSVEARSP